MFEKIREIIVDQLGVSEDEVTLTTSLKEELGVDSLDLFEIIMQLEETFGVEIPSEDLVDAVTIEDVIKYLNSKGITE
ncbi:MAG: acyl carrier protein [Clostridium sp.]|nr:acyl carrier protein [Clostridium sp.]MDY3827290.1 acyl carrier protein [Clostridium sp.]